MAFPYPTNCAFDVYRGFNPADPYDPPNRPAALKGVKGHLRHHARGGRFGRFGGAAENARAKLWWTNVLLLPVGTDVRSAYDTGLNAFAEANGDTLLVADYPTPGTCTAFLVVLVQRRARGTGGEHLRVYLDRARPSYGVACIDPDGVPTACCANPVPRTLHATFSGTCACFSGLSVALTWEDANHLWQTDSFPACDGVFGNQFLQLSCAGGTWFLARGNDICWQPHSAPDAVISCDPLHLQWTFDVGSYSGDGCCAAGTQVVLDVTQ
jgi:hypothetical protein